MGAERDRFVLATKFSLNMRAGDPNAGGNHRKAIVQSLEASLRRLGTDYVDLYWLHQWDGTTPVEEVMRALDDLVRAGKVLYVGISDTPAWVAAQANTLAGLRGWSPFVGLQIEYSLIERTPERELLPMARAFGLGITPWGVVAGGVLTGKYQADPKAPRDALRAKLNVGSQRTSERALRIAAEVQAVAAELGRSPAQVALAWARRQSPQLIPIVGARTAAQLRDNLACLEVALEPAHLERLDAVSRIELGFPHDFLSIPRIVEQRFGGTQDRIDFRGE
jgi:aryl-alcohol dehydrogenase-like predicted oxidoreductase